MQVGLPGRLRRGDEDLESNSDMADLDDSGSDAGDNSFCIGVAYTQVCLMLAAALHYS